MNIKFIKDAPQNKVGDELELDAFHANAIIAMGYAEEVKEVKPKTTTKKATVKKDNS